MQETDTHMGSTYNPTEDTPILFRYLLYVVFGEAETFEVQRANLDGTNRETLISLASQPQGFAVDVLTNK